MKKIFTILLTMTMMLGLVACGDSSNQTQQTTTEDTPVESTTSIEETTESSETINESIVSSEVQTEETDISEEETGGTETMDTQGSKVLVVYFSATGTTKKVAENIANGLNADIYEIVPEEPYTDDDLNYNDNNSRSTIEMNDPDSRPAISGSVENMEQYTTVFIGYPIWWYDAPRIVSTFVESYDFSGKTIVPFCTSGGSGIGSSATNLEQLTSGAEWLSGSRLNGNDSQDTVMEWVNSLGLNFEE